MTTEVATIPRAPLSAEALEKVMLQGDLASLSSKQRVEYLSALCDSLGLNALSKPFEFIKLNGALRCYATRDCCDQLRKLHAVSIQIVSRELKEDIYIVTAQATDARGRRDESIGALSVKGINGMDRANALMKCETKAKRRVTLSICGLGFLDETEVEDAEPVRPRPARHIIDDAAAVAEIRGALDADALPDPPEWSDIGEPEEPAEMIISDGQVKAIHTLKTKLGLTDDRYRGYLKTYRVESSLDLTKAQAREFIDKLQADLTKREGRAKDDSTARDLAAFVDPDKEKRALLGREILLLASNLKMSKEQLRERFGDSSTMSVERMTEVAVQLEHEVNGKEIT